MGRESITSMRERERETSEYNGQLSCAVRDPKQVKRRKLQLHNSEEPNA